MDIAEATIFLQQISLSDMMALREALFGFFDSARTKSAGVKDVATP